MLGRADLERSLESLGRIAEQSRDRAALARAGVRELPRLVGSELTTLSICHLKTGRREVTGFPVERIGAEDRACFDRHFDRHPLVRYHAGRRGGGAHRISDSIPFSRFRHSALYSEYYRRIRIDHVVAVPVTVDDDVLVSFVLNRCGRDFSRRDCAVLDRLGPLLARLYAALPATSPWTEDGPGSPSMTPRERQVLRWLAAGKTDRDIGLILGCSHRTVHKHLQRIYEKLGVETRTAALGRVLGVPMP